MNLMQHLQQKRILVLALLLSFTVLLILAAVFWNSLIHSDAKRQALKKTQMIFERVDQVDQLIQRELTEDTLSSLVISLENPQAILNNPKIQSIENATKEIFQTEKLFLGLYTECEKPTQKECYVDTDPLGFRDEQYQPQNRPWYLSTRSHSDWVLLRFMRLRATKRSGYPPVWGWALSKRFLLTKKSPPNQLWLNIYLVGTPFRDHFSGSLQNLKNLQTHFQNIRFYEAASANPQKITCKATTEYIHLPFTYKAFATCSFGEQSIQYEFFRTYNQVFYLVLLCLAGLIILMAVYYYFDRLNKTHLKNLKNQSIIEKAKLTNTVGMKLIHDLRKGITSQLNYLVEAYDDDLDEESKEKDFLPKLKENLKNHFRSIRLLNRYIDLLTNNIKHYKEKTWVPFDDQSLKNYISWIYGVEGQYIDNNEEPYALKMVVEDNQENFDKKLILQSNPAKQGFLVPEMSFYRILKNLIGNFHAHGKNHFELTIETQDNCVTLCCWNPSRESSNPQHISTELGLKIIEQLLEDNFGKENITVRSFQDEQLYRLTLEFPLITGGQHD